MNKASSSLSKLNVLITRPAPKAQALVDKLTQQGIHAIALPLYEYLPSKTPGKCKHLLTRESNEYLIFVSTAAVEFANNIISSKQWCYQKVFAVGKATQQVLKQLNINAATPEQQNTEGLLALPLLTNVKQKEIIIIRGDEGRELLFEQLTQRNANVYYAQSYQRHWQTLTKSIIENWRQQEINCIVNTSVAMLENMVSLLVKPNNYWQCCCSWLVASERIAQRAKELGLHHVINAGNADNESLFQAMIQMEK